LKIGTVPTSAPTIRGSCAIRASTSAVTTAASVRKAGSGRSSAIQAMPGTIRARATVSQPLSSAMVSASASAATAPVAKIAPEAARPGRGARRFRDSVAAAARPASSKATLANGTE